MRRTYGNTWWGKQWLNALNDIDLSNRLPRGRSLAKNDKVLDIQFAENIIKAKVKDTRALPYRIKILFPTFSNSDIQILIDQIIENPFYLSKLLNRQLPVELFDFCLRHRIFIFPNTWDDLEITCTCSDMNPPCKHTAAVLFLIANEIDKNPFLVFHLHGVDLFAELEKRGLIIKGGGKTQITSVREFWTDEYIFDEKELGDRSIFEQIDFSIIPPSKENIFALLTPKPPFYIRGDFKKFLYKAYTTLSKKMIAYAKAEKSDIPSFFNRVDEINIFLNEELNFQKAVLYSNGKQIFQTERLEYLVEWLDAIPAGQINECMPPMMALYGMYQFAIKLIQQSAFMPQIVEALNGRYGIRWMPALVNSHIRNIFNVLEQFISNEFIAFRIVENGKKAIKSCPPEQAKGMLLHIFMKHFIVQQSGYEFEYEYDDTERLFLDSEFLDFDEFETREIPNIIHLWLNKFFINEKEYVPLIKVEEKGGLFNVKLFIENRHNRKQPIIPLPELFNNEQYANIRLDILQDLALLTDHFPQMQKLLTFERNQTLVFNGKEFSKILFETLPAIRLFGIRILLPKALRKLINPKVSMEIAMDEGASVQTTSMVNLDTLLNFDWKVAIGDKMLEADEFLNMVKGLEGIVKIQDQYVYLEENEIQKLIDKIKSPPKVDGLELFKIALAEEYDGAAIELTKEAQQKLQDLLLADEVIQPEGLKATLRPYQLRGYEWLYKNSKIGFGSLIADDMGLGKTLQVITTLLKFKEEGILDEQKAIAIVPTTLLTNWYKEIKKFAPALNVLIYHGSNRKLRLKENDLILTTYGIVRSETTKLAKHKWAAVIIDEAQNIKNPQTAQTKAVKRIKGMTKIAMTGTPVENRLSEYWSIFDFINKGYLYGLKKFKDRYARPIEVDRDKKALSLFKKVTQPFILRRVKSDKSIIKDLPDKIETDQYCFLSTQQAALYQNVVDNVMKEVEHASGIERRGMILKLLTALKQICNHPAQYLKQNTIEALDSGKTQLLLDLLKSIFQANEKVIIFTQYRQMGDLLVQLMDKEFSLEVPFLHGGVSRRNRDMMVEDFQEKSYIKAMLISLKAGGTGLNLTAASNVIHYDLWWNPAVEAQATDRAYRIGQKKNVQVHRFITQRTFEEKINKMIQSKKELADLTVSVGEQWIGELSNKDLKELIKLE